jgi:site-specific recombinase XerD
MGDSELPHTLIRPPRYEESTPEFVSEEDFYMIDEWLDESNYKFITKRLIFRLLWETGARINEILDLNLDDIDVQKQSALIKRQKNMQKNIIMWGSETQELLVKYLGMRLCQDYKTDSLFISPKNCTASGLITRLTARSVQRWIKSICDDIGIEKKLTPHSFRHGKAHKIMNISGRQEDIKQILGHKSLFSSDKYTRLNILEQSRLQVQYL